MKLNFRNIFIASAITAMAFTINSCVKDEFDTPPVGGEDPNLTVTHSISALKGFYNITTHTPHQVTSDIIVAGIVIADDQSGNFYKEIVIQDSTSGISIVLDRSSYYNTYRIGRRVFIKCNGLWLSDYNGLIQLGGYIEPDGSLARIPSSLVSKHLVPGSYNHTVTPKKISLPAGLDLINTLVQIDSVEFNCGEAGSETYADVINKVDINRTLRNCSGRMLTVRSSGYGDFAAQVLPGGNGTITGVLQIFDSNSMLEETDFQLKLRTTGDVNMNGLRCDGSTSAGVTVTAVNQDFTGLANNADLALCDWKNEVPKGNRKWQSKIFGANTYAQATAFGSGLTEMESWIISPPIDLSKADTLTFNSAYAFWVHDGLSVWISTNYDGTNFSSATWTQLNSTIASSGNTSPDTFISSGIIGLTGFSGIGRIGFKYSGSATNNLTTTYRVDDVVIY